MFYYFLQVHTIRESTGFLEALTAPTPSIRRKKKPTTPTTSAAPAVLIEPVSSVPDDVPITQSRQGGIKLIDAVLPVPPQLQPPHHQPGNKAGDRRSDSPEEDKKSNHVREFNVRTVTNRLTEGTT